MGAWLELLQVEYKKTEAPFDMNGAFAFLLFFSSNVEITQHYHYNRYLNVMITIKVVQANVKICL